MAPKTLLIISNFLWLIGVIFQLFLRSFKRFLTILVKFLVLFSWFLSEIQFLKKAHPSKLMKIFLRLNCQEKQCKVSLFIDLFEVQKNGHFLIELYKECIEKKVLLPWCLNSEKKFDNNSDVLLSSNMRIEFIFSSRPILGQF